MADGSVTQSLHLMNAPDLFRRVTSDEGRSAKLAASEMPPEKIVEELYLLCYGRLPDADEIALGLQVFAAAGATRRQATEDLLWALINTPEFVFND
jgi:hypothetical protein